jgi:hypothetical protein
MCDNCMQYYKQRMRTILRCYKVHFNGDLARFVGFHEGTEVGSKVKGGKIVMTNFRTVCNCGVV